tara:strand:- start:19205 stop:21130 length:1926 start_codon:yes stop_codon:yes gene_type:complete
MTFYKYVKREAGSQVNWAEISKNMSDMLIEQRNLREKKKADIDAATREFQTVLDNAPESEHKGMAEFTLDFTDNIQKAYLMQDKLLKSGGLSLRDYTVQRQNMVEGVNNTFNILKSWNEDFMVAKEKMDADQLSAFSTEMMERVESFGNIKNSKIFINPTNFKLTLAKTYIDDDGVERMSENANDHTTIDSLKVRMTQLIDKFDVDLALAEDVSYLADVYQEAINNKTIKTIDDLRRNPEYSNAVNDMIQSVLTSGMDAGSILADNGVERRIYERDENGDLVLDSNNNPIVIGTEKIDWQFTQDPDEAASDVRFILVKENDDGSLVPQLTEEQEEIAADWLNTKIEVMVQKKEEAAQKFAPKSNNTNPTGNRTVKEKKNLNISRILNAQNIIGGTEEEFESAITPIVNRYDGNKGDITNIDRVFENGQLVSVVIEYNKDGQLQTTTIDYYNDDNTPRSANDIIKEFYEEVNTKGTSFEGSLNDYNKDLLTFDEFDPSQQSWERGDTEYEDYDISLDMQSNSGETYEELFAALPTGKDNFIDAANLINKTIDQLRGAGISGGTYTPTVEEANKIKNELGYTGGKITEKNKGDWVGKGYIDVRKGTNILVFKVNGKTHALEFDDDGASLWQQLYEVLNQRELD